MTYPCMLLVSSGYKGTTSWEELPGISNILYFSATEFWFFLSKILNKLHLNGEWNKDNKDSLIRKRTSCRFSYSFDCFLTSSPLVCSFLPYVGWATIIMTEKPIIKVCNLQTFLSGFRFYFLCISDHISDSKKKEKISHLCPRRLILTENLVHLQYILIGALGLLAITSKD